MDYWGLFLGIVLFYFIELLRKEIKIICVGSCYKEKLLNILVVCVVKGCFYWLEYYEGWGYWLVVFY